MPSLILYPINIETAPNNVMREAFRQYFSPFEEYDWVNIKTIMGMERAQLDFLEILRTRRPDYCFMQLQNEGNMHVEMIREMAKHTKIINWSGDIRQTKEWYDWFIAIGKEIHLTLFSNETDVEILRKAGARADYLQVGFDHAWYRKQQGLADWPAIVYCANDYGKFQLSGYRQEAVKALHKHFGKAFQVYGSGWDKHGITTGPIDNQMESLAYNSAKIAISVSNFQFERYYSDRLLRIMACGCLPMSHEFSGLEKDFVRGENIVTFSDTQDLITKCEYYLTNKKERERIATNAFFKAHRECRWVNRMEELLEVLNKYQAEPPASRIIEKPLLKTTNEQATANTKIQHNDLQGV